MAIVVALPYLNKYDGMSKLHTDLAAPSTPEGWESIISEALERATSDTVWQAKIRNVGIIKALDDYILIK